MFLDLCSSFSLVTQTINTELADLLKASLNKQSWKFRLYKVQPFLNETCASPQDKSCLYAY